ncbi:MAG: zinc-ribbon domain-containing protein [Oscillospiraceae bacterium]|nr:zinc-ribbon domain-containing protein [Oscillospiraceae bacterium]
MRCTQCGANNYVGATFCRYCGNALQQGGYPGQYRSMHPVAPPYSPPPPPMYPPPPPPLMYPPPPPMYPPPIFYPPPMFYPYPGVPQKKGKGITSMIFGIVAVLIGCCQAFGIVPGILALVFGILSVKNEPAGKGMGIAGIITGSIGILLGLVYLFFMIVFQSVPLPGSQNHQF